MVPFPNHHRRSPTATTHPGAGAVFPRSVERLQEIFEENNRHAEVEAAKGEGG